MLLKSINVTTEIVNWAFSAKTKENHLVRCTIETDLAGIANFSKIHIFLVIHFNIKGQLLRARFKEWLISESKKLHLSSWVQIRFPELTIWYFICLRNVYECKHEYEWTSYNIHAHCTVHSSSDNFYLHCDFDDFLFVCNIFYLFIPVKLLQHTVDLQKKTRTHKLISLFHLCTSFFWLINEPNIQPQSQILLFDGGIYSLAIHFVYFFSRPVSKVILESGLYTMQYVAYARKVRGRQIHRFTKQFDDIEIDSTFAWQKNKIIRQCQISSAVRTRHHHQRWWFFGCCCCEFCCFVLWKFLAWTKSHQSNEFSGMSMSI